MRSWPTLADHIVHVFQYEVIVFACCSLFVGFHSPLLPNLLSYHGLLCSSRFKLSLTSACLWTPLPPSCSPHKSPRPLRQCKGALPPANGKLLRHLALLSRYCEKHLSRWETRFLLISVKPLAFWPVGVVLLCQNFKLKGNYTNFTHSSVYTGLGEHYCICEKK